MRSARSFAAFAAVFSVGAPAVGAVTHQVSSGDTLYSIARRYGTTVNGLVSANGLANANLIAVGQILTIPSDASKPPPPATYTVAAGDTLVAISIRLGVSLTELVRVNGIADPDLIQVGTTLTVPGATSPPGGAAGGGTGVWTQPTAAPAGTASEHVVASGETLGSIADNYGVGVGELISANAISNPDLIYVGQRLAIPGASLPVELFGRSATSQAKRSLVPMFNRWADANSIPRDLVKAVAYHESGWNNDAVSSVGALGIGQLMPDTATFISTTLIGVRLDPHIPEDNIRMMCRYLRYLLTETGGNVDQALASYYQGLSSVRSRGWYDDTKQYVANVKVLRPWFV